MAPDANSVHVTRFSDLGPPAGRSGKRRSVELRSIRSHRVPAGRRGNSSTVQLWPGGRVSPADSRTGDAAFGGSGASLLALAQGGEGILRASEESLYIFKSLRVYGLAGVAKKWSISPRPHVSPRRTRMTSLSPAFRCRRRDGADGSCRLEAVEPMGDRFRVILALPCQGSALRRRRRGFCTSGQRAPLFSIGYSPGATPEG